MVPDGRTALASICRIPRLDDKVLLNIEEGTVIVVVNLAELQEVLAQSRTPLDFGVIDDQLDMSQVTDVPVCAHLPSRV